MASTKQFNTQQRGVELEGALFSLQAEIYDRSDPAPDAINYMRSFDPQAQALEWGITLPLQGAKWKIVEAPDDSGEAEKIRDWLTRSRFQGGMSVPMQTLINQMCDGPFLKRVYFEKIAQRNADGSITYKKLAMLPPLTCAVRADKTDGSFAGMSQRGIKGNGMPFHELWDANECFVYIHRNERKPLQGQSVFSAAYGDYEDKLKVQRLWNLHLMKFALRTGVGRYRGAERDGARKLFDKLSEWFGGGGIISLDRGEEVEIVGQSGAGQEFQDRVQFLDNSMAGSVLLQFLNLGTGSNVGSWALSRDHSDFFLQALQATLVDMATSLSTYVIAPLVEWNFGEGASYPTFEFEDLGEGNKQLALDVWAALVPAATHPGGKLWEEMSRLAAERMGIDWDVVQEADGEDGPPEVTTNPAVPGAPLPALGNANSLRAALEALSTPPSSNGGSNAGVPS